MEQGWFLAFDPAIIDDHIKNIMDQCLSQVILVQLPEERSLYLSGLIKHLYAVYTDGTQMFQKNIIQAIVTALLYHLVSAYLSIEQFGLVRHSARSIEITKKFKQLLRHNFKTLKKPSEYAAKMNITVSYLNDTVRSVSGFAVTYFIQQELMTEARRLLYYSDLSVKEIADTLGFEDDKYFNRLFSKVIGVSPGVFRKSGEATIHFFS